MLAEPFVTKLRILEFLQNLLGYSALTSLALRLVSRLHHTSAPIEILTSFVNQTYPDRDLGFCRLCR